MLYMAWCAECGETKAKRPVMKTSYVSTVSDDVDWKMREHLYRRHGYNYAVVQVHEIDPGRAV